MIELKIQTIPNSKQRYKTLGDWFDVQIMYPISDDRPKERSVIHVSEFNDPRMEILIGLHELVEMILCKHRGISARKVDEFDFNWKGEGDPGNDPAAPYFNEHQFASVIERMVAHELGVDWNEYEKRCDEVFNGEKT